MNGFPITSATKELESIQAKYSEYRYVYEKSGAVTAAQQMNVPEHAMIKTLVMETNKGEPLIILMHSEKRIDLKELAQHIGVKNVSTVSVKDAEQLTGYKVGGISPFGIHTKMDIYVEETILDLDYLYLNGGKRGFILGMTPHSLVNTLKPITVRVAK